MVDPAAANLSLFADLRRADFVAQALDQLAPTDRTVILTDAPSLGAIVPDARVLHLAEAGLSAVPIRFDTIRQRLSDLLDQADALIVDMSWTPALAHSAAGLDAWGALCDAIAAHHAIPVVSIYDTNLLIEDHFLSALRAHSHILAPSGRYPNPFWIPAGMAQGTTLSDQMAFVLQRIVPDYADTDFRPSPDADAATGVDPRWTAQSRQVEPNLAGATGWKVCCLGRIRIYDASGAQIRWDIPGGAPKKSKALFAFLLQRGERGARASVLAELLWPEEPVDEIKRKRLHHAIAMLRRTLGGKDRIRRMGDYYALVPPPNTWVDIASFEQLCNRAKFMTEDHQYDRAMSLLDAADRLYAGDLFEDLASEFVETEVEDWVMPRRIWLREMAIKVQLFKAEILRGTDRLRDALACCQKALSMDPLSDTAHAEAMRILHDQGRPQAVTRQYRQYLASLDQIDAGAPAPEIAQLYRDLTGA